MAAETVGRFKKKPVEVEAIRWTGDNIEEIVAFMAPHEPRDLSEIRGVDALLALPGGAARKGDWVIKEPERGHFAPCDPDEFEATYEPASSPSSSSSKEASWNE